MMMHLATKMDHYATNVVLDEDVLDGSLAAEHKAVLLCGIDYLDPGVIDGLAAFARGGGVVLVGSECKVKIPGATILAGEHHRFDRRRDGKVERLIR